MPQNRRWQYTTYGNRLKNEQKYSFKNKKQDTDEACSSMASNNQPFQFKIASYNILAPSLLTQNFYLYKDINQSYTDWNYRRAKIYNEIKNFKADVIYSSRKKKHLKINN